jgi:alkanesulfonate monooxygenase
MPYRLPLKSARSGGADARVRPFAPSPAEHAWYKPEFERAGIVFADHADRYAYGTEWIRIFSRLAAGERVDFAGRYFTVSDYQLRPTGRYRARPVIYAGGESEAAQILAAEAADIWFINGQPPDNIRTLIAAAQSRPRKGPPLRFGLSAFVVARETDAEAQDELADLFKLADQDEPYRAQSRANTDPKAVMFQTFAKNPHVGSNGGTAAGLVGSYDTVARRIRDFAAMGIEIFMLQFQPFEVEMRRFAQECGRASVRIAWPYKNKKLPDIFAVLRSSACSADMPSLR